MDPLTRASFCKAEIVGFDTEYTSEGAELLSFQLSWNGNSSFTVCKSLTIAKLAKAVLALGVPRGSEVMLVSYFSLAELQFLPVKREAYSWREYGSGSLDCSFYSEESALTLHVFDLARFFDKQSLAKVAQSFGLKKLDWNRTKVTHADIKRKGFKEYAINDAELCVEIVSQLRSEFAPYGIDPIHEKTAASTAASVFRRGWVTTTLESGNSRARLAGMKACWGGRAEACARGEFEKVYEYDLKSAYPNAAISLREMPVQGSWIECRSLRKLLEMQGGFASVRFSFPRSTRYPSLPVILPDCQLYPLEGAEWVTLDEIRYAISCGASIQITEAWGYKKGTTVLRDYLQEILAKRATAEGAQKVALKLLANSLIGKFAQRVSDINVDELRSIAEKEGIDVDDLGKMTRAELQALGLNPATRVGAVFMPEWNALITGRVRARIGQLAAETNAIYIATDAVWCTEPISKLPPDLELKRSGPAIVARTRLGLIDGEGEEEPHVAHHSIWNRRAAIGSLRNLEEPRKRYLIRKPIKLRESIRKGVNVGTWEKSFRIADTSWDCKRRLLDDGSSEPWRNADEYRNAVSVYQQERKAAKKAERDNPSSLGPI
jgi:hypothetical protein